MPSLLPPRRPPRSTLASDTTQFVLPLAVEAAGSSDQNRVADEAPGPQRQFSKMPQAAEPRDQQSSPVHGIRGGRNRNGAATSAAGKSLPPEAKLLVSRKVAAEMLSISVRGVDYLIAARRLSTRRIANRVLVPTEEIRRFARSDHPERLAG